MEKSFKKMLNNIDYLLKFEDADCIDVATEECLKPCK